MLKKSPFTYHLHESGRLIRIDPDLIRDPGITRPHALIRDPRIKLVDLSESSDHFSHLILI